ncbi:MAG: nucleotidyltransferase family protein [Spirochaetales bacterium]|jgi:molybdenum cofactor cytidylyltransferase
MAMFNEAVGSIPCILLAAGASARMGSHKLLLPLAGEPMVRMTAKIVLARCSPLVVVTGYGKEGVEAALEGLSGILFVHNAEWRAGMARSAIIGIDALPQGVPGFFLHHADMPFVSASAFDLLARAAAERESSGAEPIALVAGRKGQGGHPVYFPISYRAAITALGGGERLKSVLDQRGFLIVETGSDGVLEDVDEPEAYTALAAKYGLLRDPKL